MYKLILKDMNREDFDKIQFTHLWVDGFGWENTILLPTDFDAILKMPIKSKCGNYVFMAYIFDEKNEDVKIAKLKGNYMQANIK